MADAVTFVGSRGRDELRYYYSAADVFVTTPWYEPFGITPLEAMACGTPVVGAAVGGIKTTVVDGETGYLVPPERPRRAGRPAGAALPRPRPARGASAGRPLRRANALFTWEKRRRRGRPTSTTRSPRRGPPRSRAAAVAAPSAAGAASADVPPMPEEVELAMTRDRAVFLDKDGTLIEDVPYNVDPDADPAARRGAAKGCARCTRPGYRLVVVSNQSGVALGLFPESALAAVEGGCASCSPASACRSTASATARTTPTGASRRYAVACDCRKPRAGHDPARGRASTASTWRGRGSSATSSTTSRPAAAPAAGRC